VPAMGPIGLDPSAAVLVVHAKKMMPVAAAPSPKSNRRQFIARFTSVPPSAA
jgi:hypothetical protein